MNQLELDNEWFAKNFPLYYLKIPVGTTRNFTNISFANSILDNTEKYVKFRILQHDRYINSHLKMNFEI